MINILRYWLPLAIVVTIILGTIYLIAQQSYRQNANDPQIQMAEDASSDIAHGKEVTFKQPSVEISESLSPYIIVFDESGKQVLSNATLHGKAPELPQGVFQTAKARMETRFTWQPEVGVRQAVVLRYIAQKGYVISGRSLREVENREEMLLGYVFLGWVSSLTISLITASLLFFLKKN